MADERGSPDGILVPPPLIYAGGLPVGLILDNALPQVHMPKAASRLMGGLLLGCGMLLAGWFSRTMRNADTPFRLDKPAAKLVTDSPFRYSRNPGYVSFALIYASVSAFRNSLWSMILLPAVLLIIRRQAIEKEERYLERAFGEEYRRYKARTPRWIQVSSILTLTPEQEIVRVNAR